MGEKNPEIYYITLYKCSKTVVKSLSNPFKTCLHYIFLLKCYLM